MPDSILDSMTRSAKAVTMSLVPLHSPGMDSMLRSKMMGQPTLIVMECLGNPERLIVLRYSFGTESS